MRIPNWSLCLAVVATSMWLSGCGDEKPGKTSTTSSISKTDTGKETKEAHHEHGPGHEHGAGPHGGAVADWGGGKFHVEFTVDHGKKEATVYVLGSDEKTPTPIKAKELQLMIKSPAFQVALKPAPQKGDPEGASSQFSGVNENLGKVQEFSGTIVGDIEGTPYTGDFAEEPDEHPEKK